jgi:hypothetical protein
VATQISDVTTILAIVLARHRTRIISNAQDVVVAEVIMLGHGIMTMGHDDIGIIV